jgi:hypothetical protein
MEHESTVVTPSVTPPLFCGPSPQATDLNSSGVFDYGHGALFPAAASFFELARTGVLDVAALAFFAVPAIELDSHRTSAHGSTS